MGITKVGAGVLDRFRDEKTYHHKVFEELLYDAVLLTYTAHDQHAADDLSPVPYTLTRAAVISSCLLLECGANCCVDSMDKTGAYKEDVDKLPFLTKFELFLDSLKRTTKLDRGSTKVQRVSELKVIRDNYVHPKVKKKDWVFEGDAHKSVDLGETPMLRLPLDIHVWKPEHSVVAFRAVNEFFAHYFSELCGFDSDTTCDLLLSNSKVTIPATASYAIDADGTLDRAIREWGLSFKWLGKS